MRDMPEQLFHSSQREKAALDVGLLSVVTASPPNVVTQDEVLQGTKQVFAEHFHDFGWIASMFTATGIEERRVTQPFDWYFGDHGWPERMRAYIEGADALFMGPRRARSMRRGSVPRMWTRSSQSPRPASPRRAWKRVP